MYLTEASIAHKLLIQLKHGDKTALGELHGRFGKEFYDRARKMGFSPEDAEDAVQETFIKIMLHIGTYQEERNTGSHWMRKIHQNTVADIRRKSRAGPSEAELSVEKFDAFIYEKIRKGEVESDPVYNEVERNESRAAIKRALATVSQEDLLIIRTRFEKPGPRGREFEGAVQRARAATQEHFEHDQSFPEGEHGAMKLQIDHKSR